jgi:hypothetical protein
VHKGTEWVHERCSGNHKQYTHFLQKTELHFLLFLSIGIYIEKIVYTCKSIQRIWVSKKVILMKGN